MILHPCFLNALRMNEEMIPKPDFFLQNDKQSNRTYTHKKKARRERKTRKLKSKRKTMNIIFFFVVVVCFSAL